MKLSATIRKICIYLVFLIFSFIVLYPLIVVVLDAFKSNLEIFKNPIGFPKELYFKGFQKAFVSGNYLLYFRNSLAVVSVTVLIVLSFASLASYAIGLYRFRGNNYLYFFFLVGTIIPIRLGTLNLFELMIKLNLFDTLLSVILVYSAIGIPLAMFILVPFIRQIPRELVDAAHIDGCSHWQLFLKIVLPLIRPALATVAILTFIQSWNEFYFSLIFLHARNLFTVPLGVSALFGQYQQDMNTAFSVLTIAIVPTILFYSVMSRNFVEGLTAGAVKG
jgi:raffinose/stachyose/melibiose transport system permease protein